MFHKNHIGNPASLTKPFENNWSPFTFSRLSFSTPACRGPCLLSTAWRTCYSQCPQESRVHSPVRQSTQSRFPSHPGSESPLWQRPRQHRSAHKGEALCHIYFQSNPTPGQPLLLPPSQINLLTKPRADKMNCTLSQGNTSRGPANWKTHTFAPKPISRALPLIEIPAQMCKHLCTSVFTAATNWNNDAAFSRGLIV